MYTAPQAAYASSAVLCVTDGAGVRHMPRLRPMLTDFGLQPYSRT